MDIYSGHLLPCYLLLIDHHCNLSLVPIILKSPSMDSSLHGDAFPSNDFSSEFQFDCAFGFDGEFDFGFGGDFNFLSAHESGFGGSPLGDDQFEYGTSVKLHCHISRHCLIRIVFFLVDIKD
jgi:hypothetical protein